MDAVITTTKSKVEKPKEQQEGLLLLFSGDIGLEILSHLFQRSVLDTVKELIRKRLVCKVFLCRIDAIFSDPRFFGNFGYIPKTFTNLDQHLKRGYMPRRLKILQQNLKKNIYTQDFKVINHNPEFLFSKSSLSTDSLLQVYSTCCGKLTKLLSVRSTETFLKSPCLIDNVFVLTDKTIDIYLLYSNETKKLVDVSDWNMKEEEYLQFSSFCVGDYFVIKHHLENKLNYYFIPKKIVRESKGTIDFLKSSSYTIEIREGEIAFGENDFCFITKENNHKIFKIVDFSGNSIAEYIPDPNPEILSYPGSCVFIHQLWGEYNAIVPFHEGTVYWDVRTNREIHPESVTREYYIISTFMVWITNVEVFCSEKDWIEEKFYFKIKHNPNFFQKFFFWKISGILDKLSKQESFLFSIVSRKDVFPYFFGKENPPSWIQNFISFVYSGNRTSHGISKWNEDIKCIELDGFANDDKSTK